MRGRHYDQWNTQQTLARFAAQALIGSHRDLVTAQASGSPPPVDEVHIHREARLGASAAVRSPPHAHPACNPMLAEHVVHDLNADPVLPFADESFDDVTCCVSVDYLIHPVTVFREVARILRPSGRFILTFSNRCFPTKAIQGWLDADDEQHVQIVAAYFSGSATFGPVRAQLRTPPGPGDPLYTVWAPRLPAPSSG